MRSYSKEEPLLRINTKKFSAVPLKDIKKESIVITTAKKSSVRTNIKCDECGTLINRNDTKKCNECGKNVCPNCLQLKK